MSSASVVGSEIELLKSEMEMVDTGRVIPAIKAVRERSGCFLIDAKRAVDAYRFRVHDKNVEANIKAIGGKTVYDRIEKVIRAAQSCGWSGVAPHEFVEVILHTPVPGDGDSLNGRRYVGCSEATLGRRMREMVVAKRLTSKLRDGKTFKEFSLAVKS